MRRKPLFWTRGAQLATGERQRGRERDVCHAHIHSQHRSTWHLPTIVFMKVFKVLGHRAQEKRLWRCGYKMEPSTLVRRTPPKVCGCGTGYRAQELPSNASWRRSYNHSPSYEAGSALFLCVWTQGEEAAALQSAEAASQALEQHAAAALAAYAACHSGGASL